MRKFLFVMDNLSRLKYYPWAIMKTKNVIPPLLFALFPVLALLSNNIHQVQIVDALRSLAISFSIGLITFGMCFLLFREINKAALTASFFLILFFSYGHIYESLKTWFPDLAYLVRHRYLLPLFRFFILTWFMLVWKVFKDTIILNQIANLVAFILLIFPLFTILKEEFFVPSLLNDEEQIRQQLKNIPPAEGDVDYPDIYYIILDGYGRSDVLRQLYGCDNSDFITKLEKLGFYIADGSTSNYNQTVLSLASTLNMEYLNYLVDILGEGHKSYDVQSEMLHHSEVRRILKAFGYDFVSFASNYPPTEIKDADYYWSLGEQLVESETFAMLYGWSLNNFESLLATTTFIRAFIDLNSIDQDAFYDQIIGYQYIRHINAIYQSLFSLDEVSALDGPQFTFAHIISSHPPFVLNSNGELSIPSRPYALSDGSDFEGSEGDYIAGYCQQMHYVNKIIPATVDRILANSDHDPIIIIQGDHGPGAYLDWNSPENSNLIERMGILNAYHMPESIGAFLYSSITPVNSFRVILKHYFNFEIELIEDLNYFSSKKYPFQFHDITLEVQ